MAPASLFVRLGGSPGISALVDDVVAAHLENHAIKARFLPYLALPDRLAVVKKHTCSFFEMGSGGPAAYTGRSMTDAHRGMNLSEAEYMAAMDDILGVLKKHDMSDETQRDVLAILYSLKGDILHV